MKYWYFLFEGVFKDRSLGLFSSAMVPAVDVETAKCDLAMKLEKEGIALIKIEDQFEFKISEVDLQNNDNLGWLNLYDSVKSSGGCVFTPWQVFDL